MGGTGPAAAPSPPAGYELYHDLSPRSQGALYGNAACLPTSVSMVLDYYHAQDAAHRTALPGELVRMLDPGDGTPGQGVPGNRMQDELAELGYRMEWKQASMGMAGRLEKRMLSTTFDL
ncbi:MAG: hypothetical protein ACP5OO_03065 [Chloroflexia bacterium]